MTSEDRPTLSLMWVKVKNKWGSQKAHNSSAPETQENFELIKVQRFGEPRFLQRMSTFVLEPEMAIISESEASSTPFTSGAHPRAIPSIPPLLLLCQMLNHKRNVYSNRKKKEKKHIAKSIKGRLFREKRGWVSKSPKKEIDDLLGAFSFFSWAGHNEYIQRSRRAAVMFLRECKLDRKGELDRTGMDKVKSRRDISWKYVLEYLDGYTACPGEHTPVSLVAYPPTKRIQSWRDDLFQIFSCRMHSEILLWTFTSFPTNRHVHRKES